MQILQDRCRPSASDSGIATLPVANRPLTTPVRMRHAKVAR